MRWLTRAIFGRSGPPDKGADDELIAHAIEKVVDGCDARLRVVGGYKKKLRDSVSRSIEHAQDCVQAFAAPLDVNRRAYGSDPQVHAFFGSVGTVQDVFSTSPEVRAFMTRRENGELTHFYAGMRMVREEKRVLASDLRGGIVQRDVPRIAVNFSDHHIVLPADSESGLRGELEERVFMALIECALDRLVRARARKGELEKSRSLLRSKLKALRAGGLGLQLLSEDAPSEMTDPEVVEQQLQAIERELGDVGATTQTLDHHIRLINEVMSTPGEYVRIGTATSRVTRMGFKVDPESSEPGEEIAYTELEIGDSRHFVGRLVRYPRDELVEPRRPPLIV